MTTQPPRRYTRLAMGIIVVVLIVGSLSYLAVSTSGNTPSSILTNTTTSALASSTISASGLRLTESMNASTITVGQKLNISVSIFNTLPDINNVLPSNDWAFRGVPAAVWPACYFGLPGQVVVLDGNYSLQDLRSVTANVTMSINCAEGTEIDRVIFQPDSDQVKLNGIYDVNRANETQGPYNLALNFTTAGSWNLTSLSKEPNVPVLGAGPVFSPAYTDFSPGVYTIAVADEWGQAVVIHITVVADPVRVVVGDPSTYQASPSWKGESVNFVVYQVFPVTVYAPAPTIMNLDMLNASPNIWVHFGLVQ